MNLLQQIDIVLKNFYTIVSTALDGLQHGIRLMNYQTCSETKKDRGSTESMLEELSLSEK